MKKEKTIVDVNLWRGVSTLDCAAKCLKQSFLAFALTIAFAGFIYAGARNGHSILGSVNLSLDHQIITGAFSLKFVYSTEKQPDSKILATENFNSYNREPVGGQNHGRTNVARLINSSVAAPRTPFDFDGDGRADLAVFSPSNGVWSIRNSQTNQTSNTQFGQPGDRYAPADYDGDGRADLAVRRQGVWYMLLSGQGYSGVSFTAGVYAVAAITINLPCSLGSSQIGVPCPPGCVCIQ